MGVCGNGHWSRSLRRPSRDRCRVSNIDPALLGGIIVCVLRGRGMLWESYRVGKNGMVVKRRGFACIEEGAGGGAVVWCRLGRVQGRRESRESKRLDYFCGMAPEAFVAWDGLPGGRRVGEGARRGPRRGCRVGKNRIVVKGRGVPAGLFQGDGGLLPARFPAGSSAAGGAAYPGAIG